MMSKIKKIIAIENLALAIFVILGLIGIFVLSSRTQILQHIKSLRIKTFTSYYFGGYSFKYPAYLKIDYHRIGKDTKRMAVYVAYKKATNEAEQREMDFCDNRYKNGEYIMFVYRLQKMKVVQLLSLRVFPCDPSIEYPYLNKPEGQKIILIGKNKLFIYKASAKRIPGRLIGYDGWITIDGLGIDVSIQFYPENKEFTLDTLIEVLNSFKGERPTK